MSAIKMVLRLLVVSFFNSYLLVQQVHAKSDVNMLENLSANETSIPAELSADLQLSLSFIPLAGDNSNIHYEVICKFRDPNSYDNFPYVNNFIKLDEDKSTPELYVGTVNLKGLLEPYRGAEMSCSLQYRSFQNQQVLGGELGQVVPIMIPSQPKIIQRLNKVSAGRYTLVFRYQFPEEATLSFFSLQCRNTKGIFQYNFESDPKQLDEHQVELDLRDWVTPKKKSNTRSCHLIARYQFHGGYTSEAVGYVGQL